MNKELKDEISEFAPMLSSLPKKELEAPEGYFDSFSSRMMARIEHEKIQPDAKTIPLYAIKKYLAAASIFIFMGISFYLYKSQQNIQTEDIPLEEIYVSELDENTLIEYTQISNVDEVKNETDVYQQYLDEETIIEEL